MNQNKNVQKNNYQQTTFEKKHHLHNQSFEKNDELIKKNDDDEKCEKNFDLNDVNLHFDDNFAKLKKAVENKYHIFMMKIIRGYKKCDSIYYQCFVQFEIDDASTYRMLSKKFADV